MFKKISKILPIIGIILFIYIIINIKFEKIVYAFQQIPIQFYILSLLFLVPKIILLSIAWQNICRKQKMNFKLIYLARVYLISNFYAMVTPAGIGYYTRIYYLKERSQASWEKCIANTLIDTTLNMFTGVFLALIGSIILTKYFPELLPIMLLFFIFYITLFIVFMKKERGSKIFNVFIRPFIPKKFKEKIDQSVESLYEDLPRVRDLFIPISIYLVIWLFSGIQVYIMTLAFSININFIMLIFIIIISIILSDALPISIGGLGVREGILVLLLSAFGVQPQVAFAISLSGYIVKQIIPGLVGWIYVIKEPIDYS